MVARSTPTPSPPPPLSSTLNQDGDGMIYTNTIHPDIFQTHILTRLDGPTLAAAACVSPDLRALSSEEKLWQNICTSTWPSIDDPLVSQVISMFPSGHRSFFSDSYPFLHHDQHPHRRHNLNRPFSTTELISAVDIYYQNIPIFSNVVETETESGWFLASPFRVDMPDHKEYVQTWVQQEGEKDLWLKQVEENMTLSWILIDPKQKRAMNLSSIRPVSVQRHWLTGEAEVKFSTVMAGDGGKASEREYVLCEVVVTCGGKEGGKVHVREVYVGMEDMEGAALSGKDGLVILEGAMKRGERRKVKGGREGKERFEEFVEKKREWQERKQRRERVLDVVCFATGVALFVSFWPLILFR